MYMLGGAGLVAAAAFIFAVVGLDEFCIISGDVGTCPYKSFFGWAAAPLLAVPLWMAVGAVIGGVLGRVVADVSRRN